MKPKALCWTLLLMFLGTIGPSLGQEPRPRTLLITLDAVPFWVVEEITDPDQREEALFQGFKGPVPVVSTFPSSTSVALVGMLQPLGLEKSPGYEARFFDWERGKARGGGIVSYSKIDFPWRDFYDWSRRNPAGSSIEAVRPVKSGIKRLRKAIKDFADSEREVSLIYIAATDIAVHVVGPESVKALLLELDQMIREVRARRPDRPFDTLIFSDHGVAGGNPLINVSKATKKALKAAGFRISKKGMKKPNTVVMTPFGLVSNFEAYTDDDHKAEVARVLAGVEGVDLCVHQIEQGEWRVEGPQGAARILRRKSGGEVQWRYEVEAEDPLGYGAIMQELAGAPNAQSGWMADDDVFEASKRHHFPDAFHRIGDAFQLVSNPGSVVCSLGVEYMYGAGSTAVLATIGKGKLRWTHGALNSAATMGFLMSDADYWEPPDVERYDRALLPFRPDLARHPHVIVPEVDPDSE